MKLNPLMADETLFRDPDLFEVTYLPEVFNHREAQFKGLAFAIKPALRGNNPLNTILLGPPSTGKTTAVRRIFAEVEETTTPVVPVLVSCQSEKTTYAVVSRIYLAVFGHPPPSRGPSSLQVLLKVGTALVERDAVLVVCLDDANHLAPKGVLNDVLIRILRLHEKCPGARTGVVMTDSSMNPALLGSLDHSTNSSLQVNTIFFPPYTAEEVRSILADRVRAGVYPGVVPPPVLDEVTRRTMAYGDIRVGLRLMKGALLAAEREGRKTVTTEDVASAVDFARHDRLDAVVRTLAPMERTVLAVLVGMKGQGEETTSGRVYKAVAAVEPMGYTMFFERLKRLEELNVVRTQQVKKGRGRTREIVVAEGVEEVVSGAVSAGSSAGAVNGCIGVADDEKRRYETGRR